MTQTQDKTGGWNPIETAPTDGTIIDLWVPDESFEEGGQRFADMRFVHGDHMQSAEWDSVDGMLTLSDCGYSLEDVTHWMPRPAPPSALEPAPDARQEAPMRCAECDCENGGPDCTWIKTPDARQEGWRWGVMDAEDIAAALNKANPHNTASSNLILAHEIIRALAEKGPDHD